MHTSLPLINAPYYEPLLRFMISARYITLGAYNEDMDERLVCKLVLLRRETSVEHYTDLQLAFISMFSSDCGVCMAP